MSLLQRLITILLTIGLAVWAVPASASPIQEDTPTIRFGAVLSLTGKLDSEGELVRNGYELWREQVNARGGIPVGDLHYRVEILYRDDRSDARNTGRLIDDLIAQDKVDFLLGPYGSDATFEAAATAEQHRIPLVQGGGASERIFSSGFRYTFGLLGPGQDYFKELLEGAATLEPRPSRVAIVAADQSIHAEIAEGARHDAEQLGFEIVGFYPFGKAEDLAALARKVKARNPDLILFSSYFRDAAPFVQAARATELDAKMLALAIAPSQPEFITQLGKDADYLYGVAHWLPSLPYHGPMFGSPAEYAALYRRRFAHEPDYHAAAASAAGVAYQLALTEAGSLDRETVRDTLASLDAMTFYGRIRFDERGMDVSSPVVAFQIQKGRQVSLWPGDLASGVARYPAPAWKEREPKLKVAVLHYGTVEDYGWTYAGHHGAEAMADTLPYVSLLQRERDSGSDTAEMLRELARSGHQVVFAHSYDFGDAIAQVAPEYPQVRFMWAGGSGQKAPNVGTYFGREYEVMYLTGMVAGFMTRSDRIGFVAPSSVDEVIRGINAFARGVAAVNPEARVHVKWVGGWYDPPRERELTLALIDQGCDVITQDTDSYAPAVAAEERGVHYMSYGSDMRRFAPRSFLTGMTWNWAAIMTDVVLSVRDGSWEQHPGRMWWHGLDKAGVDLLPFSEQVPEEVRQRVMERKRDIIEGRFRVFPDTSDEALHALASLEPNVVSEAPRLLEYDHPETRELVSFVMEAADAIRNEGEAVFPAFRQPGGRWFQGEQYVFVWDLQGNRYVYPPDPAHERGNMAKLEDIDGKPIGRMFIDAASSPSEEGWIHYQWYPPGDPKPIWKSTYVMRVESPSGKSYLVGSGTYGLSPERAFVSRVVDQAAALLKREGKTGFAALRDKSGPFYFHDTYVFVDSIDGVELVNPAFPALEGQSLIDTRDAKGKLLVRDYIAEASKHGAAWVSYYWPRPGSREPVLKLSYVRKVRVGDQDLIVGAGLYEQP